MTWVMLPLGTGHAGALSASPRCRTIQETLSSGVNSQFRSVRLLPVRRLVPRRMRLWVGALDGSPGGSQLLAVIADGFIGGGQHGSQLRPPALPDPAPFAGSGNVGLGRLGNEHDVVA